ncbi:hypothetical protein AOZ06_25180 [Kibdelosporangium phytohabitans]|uniref:Ricin B lectin domain-containing protein n=1 Tax=Kibdelosporangium phytohabitans TaxID=860235 RepID=A0A0N9HRC8_9PSEU|nr:hypothetical protein AOZ06_25180 [Kibdelosporangium phytohabitans]
MALGAAALVMTAGMANAADPAGRTIMSRDDSRCVHAVANTPAADVQVGACTVDDNSFRTVYYADAGNSEIRTASNLCVDGRAGRGGALEVQPCTGAASQRWNIVDDPATSHPFARLIKSAAHPGLVWDVHNHGAGSTVQLWDGIGGEHQSWIIARIAHPAS